MPLAQCTKSATAGDPGVALLEQLRVVKLADGDVGDAQGGAEVDAVEGGGVVGGAVVAL